MGPGILEDNINTIEGGTHVSGMKAALTRTINGYAASKNLIKTAKGESIGGDDAREGLTAVLSLKVPQPQFEGQTKDKLGNREAQGIVDSVIGQQIATFLEENPATAKSIVQKAIQAKQARDAARKARPVFDRRSTSFASGACARHCVWQSGRAARAHQGRHIIVRAVENHVRRGPSRLVGERRKGLLAMCPCNRVTVLFGHRLERGGKDVPSACVPRGRSAARPLARSTVSGQQWLRNQQAQ